LNIDDDGVMFYGNWKNGDKDGEFVGSKKKYGVEFFIGEFKHNLYEENA